MHTTHKRFAALAVGTLSTIALTLAATVPSLAAEQQSKAITSGHYDLVLHLTECEVLDDAPVWLDDLVGPADWDLTVRGYAPGNNIGEPLGSDEYFLFANGAGPTVGFAVKFDATCLSGQVDGDNNPVPLPGVDTFTFELGNDEVSSSLGASIVLDHADYHEDPIWEFPNGAGPYTLPVTVTGSIWQYGAADVPFRVE